MLKIKNAISQQIQTAITFYLDVRLSPIIYRDIEIKNELSEESQTAITFYSDVQLSPFIYLKNQNIKWKTLTNSNGSNFLLGSLTKYCNISRCSKFKIEAPSKLKWQ